MIIWTIKLYKSIKAAIAGRRYPHQLAAAVAFGALLGVVPHGNLLALAILIVVLSLRLNHAMAGITAIGVSFAATRLDPYSHVVGNHILTDARWGESATRAWQLPIVPYTDLNNTVVLGSFAIGVLALIPIFLVTYPIFRMFAPNELEETQTEQEAINQQTRNVAKHSVVVVDPAHQGVAAPQSVTTQHDWQTVDSKTDTPIQLASETQDDSQTQLRIDPAETDQHAETHNSDEIETRIDVIRMVDYREETTTTSPQPVVATTTETPPSDEALNYLLRQLRDSQQQRKVA